MLDCEDDGPPSTFIHRSGTMTARFFFALFLALAAGCGQKQEPAKGGEPVSSAKFTTLTWTAPEGWTNEEPSSGMRLAQYRLSKAEGDDEDAACYVSHFAGTGGSVEANLNRWYEQFVQPDARSSAAVAKVNKAKHHGFQQTTVDLSGTFRQSTTPMGPVSEEKPNFRMLGAVIETPLGPWFVKLIGPERTVARWEKSFYEFMKTFRPETRPERDS
jgi:hypothetical protein